MKESIYDYKVKDIDGNEVAMSELQRQSFNDC